MITEKEFFNSVGRLPEDDEMERVNCKSPGKFGHRMCGWCKHNRPKFLCLDCIRGEYEIKEQTYASPQIN